MTMNLKFLNIIDCNSGCRVDLTMVFTLSKSQNCFTLIPVVMETKVGIYCNQSDFNLKNWRSSCEQL